MEWKKSEIVQYASPNVLKKTIGFPLNPELPFLAVMGDYYDMAYITNCIEEKEQREIAHLIAAAPDMLEALENIENDGNQVPPHIWDMIQAAIRKAKGEA